MYRKREIDPVLSPPSNGAMLGLLSAYHGRSLLGIFTQLRKPPPTSKSVKSNYSISRIQWIIHGRRHRDCVVAMM